MNYFICAIIGTFDGCKENRIMEIQRFKNNLLKLMEIENLDNLTFCFSSSEDMSEMKRNISELEEMLKDTTIKTGPHFSYDQKYENDKVKHTSKLTGKFAHTIDILKDKELNNVYVADMSLPIQDLLKDTLDSWLRKKFLFDHGSLSGYKTYNKLIQFIPGLNVNSENIIGSTITSLSGLNDCLENYINRLIKQKHI